MILKYSFSRLPDVEVEVSNDSLREWIALDIWNSAIPHEVKKKICMVDGFAIIKGIEKYLSGYETDDLVKIFCDGREEELRDHFADLLSDEELEEWCADAGYDCDDKED